MGYMLSKENLDGFIAALNRTADVYAPVCMPGGGAFSDTDCIRYGKIQSGDEIVWDRKSDYSFKEILLPLSQTLFYFTEGQVREADAPQRETVVFLRSCDLHGVRRMDQIYLWNGREDYYYKRLREKVHFILMGCARSFDSCFCVDMKTNISKEYDAALQPAEDGFEMDVQYEAWKDLAAENSQKQADVVPHAVTETHTRVNIPEGLSIDVAKSEIWNTYDSRCINCGRCNFVCPTCTCFTMQDIYYTDNGRAGERRRVCASCMVDGFTDMAGGHGYRQKNGQRMRFRTLHKVYDYNERYGEHMCVGCGRCDDICPEYISFTHCINQLEKAVQEVNGHAAE